jgi:protein involved in sex pheromone biosynthesis
MNTKRLTIAVFASILLCSSAVLVAGQPQDSVVDAAKKAQAEKKTGIKPKMVIDNDNLGTLTGAVNVVGQVPAPPADKSKAGAVDKTAEDKTKDKPAEKGEKYWRDKFADANKKLDGDAHELDVLQREYNLKQQQYYSDPNTAMKEQYNRQDLTDTKSKIDDKTAAVAKDKQDISDLEDSLRQTGGEAGWARQPDSSSK